MSKRWAATYQGKFEVTGKPCVINAYREVIKARGLDGPVEHLGDPPLLQLTDGTTIAKALSKGRYETIKGDVVITDDPNAP